MPIFVIHLAAILVGAAVAVIANAVARRMLINPGLAAGVLSVGVAIWSGTVAATSISAHPSLTSEAQGEVFGELVIGPALLAFAICFFMYRRSARLAAAAVKEATSGRRRR